MQEEFENNNNIQDECFEEEFKILEEVQKRNKREKYEIKRGSKKKRNTCFNCCLSILILNMVLVIGIFVTGFVLGNTFLRDNVHEDLTVGSIFRMLGNINNSRGLENELIAEDSTSYRMVDQTLGAVFLRDIDTDELLDLVSDFAQNFIDEVSDSPDLDELLERLEILISAENIDTNRIRNFDYSRLDDMLVRVTGSEMRAFLNEFILNTVVLPQASSRIEEIIAEFSDADAIDMDEVDLKNILQIQQIIFYRDDGVAGINITTQTNLHRTIADIRNALNNDVLWDNADLPDNWFVRTGLNFGMFLGHHFVLRPLLPSQLFLSIDMPLSRAGMPNIRVNNTDNYDWDTLLLLDDTLGGMISDLDDLFDPDGDGIGYTLSNVNQMISFDTAIQTGGNAPACGRIALDIVAVAIEFMGLNHGYYGDEFDCDCDDNAVLQGANLARDTGFIDDEYDKKGNGNNRVRLPECMWITSYDIYWTLSKVFAIDTGLAMQNRLSVFDWTRWVPVFDGSGNIRTEFSIEHGAHIMVMQQRQLRFEEEGFNIAYFLGNSFDINTLSNEDRAVLADLEGRDFGDNFDISVLTIAQLDILLPLMQAQYEDAFIDIMRESFGLHADVDFDTLFDLLLDGDVEFAKVFCPDAIRDLINNTEDDRAWIDHRVLAAIVGRLLENDESEEEGNGNDSGLPLESIRPRFTAITNRYERGRYRDFAHIGVEIVLEDLVRTMMTSDNDEGENQDDNFILRLMLAVLPNSILASVELELTLDADADDLSDMEIMFGDMTSSEMDRLMRVLDRFGLNDEFDIDQMLDDALGQVRDVFVNMNTMLGGGLMFRTTQMVIPPVFDIMAGIMNETMGTDFNGGLEYIDGEYVAYSAGEELRRMLNFLSYTDELDIHFNGGTNFDGNRLDQHLREYYAVYGGAYALFDAMQNDPDDVLNIINAGDNANEGLRGIAARDDVNSVEDLDLILDERHIAELMIAFAEGEDADELLASLLTNQNLIAFNFIAYKEYHNGNPYAVYYLRMVLNINIMTLLDFDDEESIPMLEFVSQVLGYVYVTMTAQIMTRRYGTNIEVDYVDGYLEGLLINYNNVLLNDDEDTNFANTANVMGFLRAIGFYLEVHEQNIMDLIYDNINSIMDSINENDSPNNLRMTLENDFYFNSYTRYGFRLGTFYFRLTNIFDVAAGLISDDNEGAEEISGDELKEAINVIFNIEGIINENLAFNDFRLDTDGNYVHKSSDYATEERVYFDLVFENALRKAYAIADYQLDEYGDILLDYYGQPVPVELDDLMAILTGDEEANLEFADLIYAAYFKAIVWDDFDQIIPLMGSLYLAGMIVSNWHRFMDGHESISYQSLEYVRLFNRADRFFVTIGMSLVLEELADLDDEQSLFSRLLTNSSGEAIIDNILVSITIDVTMSDDDYFEHYESVKQFNSQHSKAVLNLINIISGADSLNFDTVETELRDSLHQMMDTLAYGDDVGFKMAYDENDDRIQINNGSDEYEAVMRLPNIFELMKTLIYSDYDDYDLDNSQRDITAVIIQETMQEFYRFDESSPFDSLTHGYYIRNAIAPFPYDIDNTTEFASTLLNDVDFIDILTGSLNIGFSDRDLGRLIYGEGQNDLGILESVTILPIGYTGEFAVRERNWFSGHANDNYGAIDLLNRDLISVTFSFDASTSDVFIDNIEEEGGIARLAKRLLPELIYLSILIEKIGDVYLPIDWRINEMSAHLQPKLYTLLFLSAADVKDSIETHTKSFGEDTDGLFSGYSYDDEGQTIEAGLMYSLISDAINNAGLGLNPVFSINYNIPFAPSTKADNSIGLFVIVLALNY